MFQKSWTTAYLKHFEDRWDAKTLNYRKSMLKKLSDNLGRSSVSSLFFYIDNNLAPYSRVTYLSMAIDYYNWLLETGRKQGENEIAKMKKRKASKYKNAYERKITGIRYEEAEHRVNQIEDKEVRDVCLILLSSGLRLSEVFQVSGGIVHGKFNVKRAFVGEEFKAPEVHPNTIRNHLRKVGLKPHDLRKAFATKIIDAGLELTDTASVMGWKSYKTAALYYQPKQDKKLKDLVKGALNGPK